MSFKKSKSFGFDRTDACNRKCLCKDPCLVKACSLCGDCEHLKPLCLFHKNKSRKDGYEGICKACVSSRKRSGYSKKKLFKKRSHAQRSGRQLFFESGFCGEVTDEVFRNVASILGATVRGRSDS